MALNLDLIGRKTDPIPYTYDQDKVILYALGIGAGVEELDFVYEKNLKVFPTFAVISQMKASAFGAKDLGLESLHHSLHGEQKLVLHRPIPVAGTLYNTAVLSAIYDKGDSGAFTVTDIETRDVDGNLLFENKTVGVHRRAGNFGGDRGPKAERFDPPAGRAADFHVEYVISPDQAALYRLSGDYNPLHIEPEFAKMGGFDRPILHGLCTFGFTGRAILHSVCGSDPARFKSFSARFTGVVFPKDTLIIEGWKTDQGTYIIQTRTQDDRVVLGNSVAEVA